MAAPEDTASRRFALAEEDPDLPVLAVVALAAVAALLVGASVSLALHAGYTAIGLGFLAAVALFVLALAVFAAGRRLGAGDDL